MDTTDRGLPHTFIGPGAVANGLTDIKTRCEVFLHVQLQLNTLRP